MSVNTDSKIIKNKVGVLKLAEMLGSGKGLALRLWNAGFNGAPSYRALVRKYFPNARIVAARFHVIRLVNHHFLNCWRDLHAVGSKETSHPQAVPSSDRMMAARHL